MGALVLNMKLPFVLFKVSRFIQLPAKPGETVKTYVPFSLSSLASVPVIVN